MIALAIAALVVVQCPDGAPPPCRGVTRTVAAAPDSHVIAVLPFRVSGADTTLAEGLAELLAVEFTGEGAPRSADMGTLLRAWRSSGGGATAPLELTAARRMATRLGAGRILSASLVATGQRLTVSAQVIGTTDGAVTARAGPILGSADSLPDLLQRIAGQLISMNAGVASGLSGVPTEALRAFMAARSAYRRSDWIEAARRFEQAFQIDSTFALAGLGRLVTDGWTTLPPTDLPRIRRLTWAYRNRLDPINQAFLRSVLGPRYPEPFTIVELLELRAEVTRLAPDNAEGWFLLGDELAHFGDLVDVDGLARGRVAMERALAIDPGLSEAALHLSSMGILSGDLELTRRYGPIALRLAPNTPNVALMRMEVAIGEGRGRRVVDSLIASVATLDPNVLGLLNAYSSAPDFLDTTLVEASFAERARRATSAGDRRSLSIQRSRWLYNRGRPLAADHELGPLNPQEAAFLRVMNALFAGGDEVPAAAAVSAWQPRPATDTLRSRDDCLLGMWWLQHGDSAAALRSASALEDESREPLGIGAWCAPLIKAGVAVSRRRSDARPMLAHADSILAQGMPNATGWEGLAAGRMWASLGDWPAAVRAVRRREWYGGGRGGSGALESERQRALGQWAARAGDTAAARDAYRRYLILRAYPEASRVPQRDSALAEQAALGGARN